MSLTASTMPIAGLPIRSRRSQSRSSRLPTTTLPIGAEDQRVFVPSTFSVPMTRPSNGIWTVSCKMPLSPRLW